MKKVTLKIPESRHEVFMELINIMGFEIYEETEITEGNKRFKKEGSKISKKSGKSSRKKTQNEFSKLLTL